MTSDRYRIISELEKSVSNRQFDGELFQSLRTKSRDANFLKDFDPNQFDTLILNIFADLENLNNQLDVISTIANILYLNENLRSAKSGSNNFNSLAYSIPYLFKSLDSISERQINSESQYKDFLPIFRLYFFMAHNSDLLPLLKDSILKISGKLLNFVALSSSESSNLNIIIIEILKIIYTYLHQIEDPTGIDSSFVLSCNKFQSLYIKEAPNKEYDEILQHFGNVLMTIPTDISQNYMLNKLKFTQNEVTFINKVVSDQSGLLLVSNSPIPNILALDVLLTIDYDDSGVKSYISDNLNFDELIKFPTPDPNLSMAINELQRKIENYRPHSPSTPPLSVPPLSFPTEYNHRLEKLANDAKIAKDASNIPRFEDLTEEEQDREIEKMNDLFNKIEKNGMFKFKMK